MATMQPMVLAALLTLTAAPSLAVTPEELASLAKAGLGDEVLLALIEATGVDPTIDAARALTLRRGGVSDRVIAAAVRASHRPSAAEGREPTSEAADGCGDCAPNIAVIGNPAPVTVVEREIYYVPWIVAVPVRAGSARPARPYFEGDRGFGRFINDGFVDRTPRPR